MNHRLVDITFKNKIVVVIIHIGIVFPLLMLYTLFSLNKAAELLIYIGCILTLCIFLWLTLSWRIIAGTLFHPYFLFLFTAILFNGGQLILEVFGLNSYGILNGMFSKQTIIHTILLVNYGFMFLHLGAILSQTGQRNFRIKTIQINKRDVQRVGWVLLSISIVPAIMIMQHNISIIMSIGYFGLFMQEKVTGFSKTPEILAAFLVPAACFLLAGSDNKKFPIYVSSFIIILNSAITFYTGVRSDAAMSLVAFLYVYDRTVYRIPRIPLILVGCLIIFVLFPAISATRNIEAEVKSISTFVNSVYALDNPIAASLSEMGNSMNTISYSLELVPLIRGFDYGLSYFFGVLTVIPNIYWELHPSIARGLLANWLVWQVDPSFASKGGGYGFSFIAEAYVNFGWLGCLFLAFLGFLLGKMTVWSEQTNRYARIAMVASFLSFFLLYARGESGSIIRPLLWYALIPYMMTYGIKLFIMRK
jgi:oligosaccharide repeat unit polymerase